MKPKLGQHFLTDPRISYEIVSALGASKHDLVIEIGAGHGILSERLIDNGSTVILIEKDQYLASKLISRFNNNKRVTIVCEDAVKIDFKNFITGNLINHKALVIGNLPYNVGLVIFFNLLNQISLFARMILMFQKEVAERIVSSPGSRKYGIPSILTNILAESNILYTYLPEIFRPRPKVNSALIEVIPRNKPLFSLHELHGLKKLINGIFKYRRKTLRNALSDAFKLNPVVIHDLIDKAGLTGRERPEDLNLNKLEKIYTEIRNQKSFSSSLSTSLSTATTLSSG